MAVVKGEDNFKALEHDYVRTTLVKEARNTINFIGGYIPPEPPAPYDKRLEWDYRNRNVESLDELREYGYTYKKEIIGFPDRLYLLGIEDGGLSFYVPMNDTGGAGILGIPAYDNEFHKGFTAIPKKLCFTFGITPGGRYEDAPSNKYTILDYKLFDPQNGGGYASYLINLKLTKYSGNDNVSLILYHSVASSGYGSAMELINVSNINNKSGYFNVYVELDYENSLATVKIGGDDTHLDGDDSDTYPNGRYWYVYTYTFPEQVKTAIANGLYAKVGTFNNFNHTVTVSFNGDVSYTKKWYFRYFKQSVEYATCHTVRFLNYNNTVLQSRLWVEGDTPTYSGATPIKPRDSQYIYTFTGWSPTISPVTQDADYVAQYKQTPIPVGDVLYSGSRGSIIHDLVNREIALIRNSDNAVLIIADRNLGATAYMGETGKTSGERNGNFFQWGNNNGFPNDLSQITDTSATKISIQGYGPGNYLDSDTFITQYVYSSDINYNMWGGESNSESDRQGPCANGYHIPTKNELENLITMFENITGQSSIRGDTFRDYLLLPYSGYIDPGDFVVDGVGEWGDIWACDCKKNGSLGRNDPYELYYGNEFAHTDDIVDGDGYCIRPFKNTQ